MQIEELNDDIKVVSSEVAKFDSIKAGIAELEKAHPSDVACDVTTTAGMKQAVAGRAAWRTPRLLVEAARKAAKAPVLELGRKVDSFAKELTAQLLIGESNYDDQIKAEEARREQERAAKQETERLRIVEIQSRIAAFNYPPSFVTSRAVEIENEILLLVQKTPGDNYQEFKPQAEAAHAAALADLRRMLVDATAREDREATLKAEQEAEAAKLKAEREELDRLRAEQAKRDEEQRAAQAEAAAAERERLAAERAKLEREQAQARAEQKRLDDEAAARRRAADEAAAAERAAADRAAAEARAVEQAHLAEEQRRLDEAAAEQRRRDQAEATARRDAEEQERAQRRAEADAQEAAQRRLHGAAQKLLDALVLAVPFVTDAGTVETCNEAISEATGEPVAT